jgi:ArsR family transcriptional regulator, arsenate/arsenite/antimonite-responsive transcriptional repressor
MQDVTVYFRALSDRKRLAILQYLAIHEQVPVTELGEELRLSQPLISWHLRVLRRAGVVKTRRTGRQVLCSLNRETLRRYQKRVQDLFGLEDPGVESAGDIRELALEPAPHSQ